MSWLDAPRISALLGVGLVTLVAGPLEADPHPPPPMGSDPIISHIPPPPAPPPTRGSAPIAPSAAPPPALGSDPIISHIPPPSGARLHDALDHPLAPLPPALSLAAVHPGPRGLTGTATTTAFAPDGPHLVALYASWCRPCAAELPVLLPLMARLEATHGVTPLFVSQDEARGPEALLASFEDLLAYAEPTTRPLPVAPTLRADPTGAWLAALADIAAHPDGLPQLLLLDARGHLRALVEGPLDPALAERLAALVDDLAPLASTP